jgi:PAS domain S-box-containing protein
MDYTLKDLLDLPQLRNLLDSLNEVQSVSSAVLDLTGELLAGMLSPEIVGTLPGAGADREGARLSNQRRIKAIVSQAPGQFLHRFPSGLVDAALPVVVAGRHLGTACAGQLFLSAPEENTLSETARQGGFAAADDPGALRQAPVVPEHLLRKQLEFCVSLIQTLAEQGLRQLGAGIIEGNRRENEGIYRSLFENTNDPILRINCGRFIDCNAAALRLLGHGSKQELLEHCPFEISPPLQPDGRSSREKCAEMIATAMQTGYHKFEWLHTRADGCQVPVEVTLTPVTIGGELILHTLWRDITERKQVENALLRSEVKFRTLFNSTSDAVLLMSDQSFFDCNDTALKVFGCQSQYELTKMHPGELSPPLQPCGTRSLDLVKRRIAETLEKGSCRFEWIHRRADNGLDFCSEVLLSTLELDGKTVLQATVRDISERREAEKSLSYSVALTNATLESTDDGILIVDRGGKIVRWNQKFIELWKVPAVLLDTRCKDQVLGWSLDQLADPKAFLDKVMELYRHPEITSQDLIVLADGRLFDRHSQPLRIGTEIVGRFWSFRDITKRKQTEEQMVDAMNYIQTILSRSPVGLETFKASGENVSANEAAARIVGAKDGELQQQNFRLVESWRSSGMLEMAERALATGVEQRGDCHVATTFGKEVDLDCLFVPFSFSGEQHLMLTLMDITERKEAEGTLSYSFSLIDAVLESTDDGILVVDLAGNIVRWNRKFLHLWQLPEELIQGADFGPVLAHVAAQLSDQELFLATRQKLHQHPESTINDLLVLIDGRLVERYSQPLRIGSAIVGRFWSFRDNTERRKLEEEVRRQNRELEQRVSERTQSLEDANCELLAINSELELRRSEAEETNQKLQQLSSAVENCSASIVIADSRGLIEYVNPKFCQVTGYPREEVIGRNPSILKADGQPGELYRELWAALSAGKEWNGDFCNRKKNGDIFWEHASISPIKSPQGAITNFVAVKEDITEQKRITGELLAAQEAALSANRAKSEFLANMSHEIRTPLSAIIGFSDLTLRTELLPRQHDYVQKILNAGDLLLSIINDILDFSKIEARQLEMEQITFRLDTVLANVADIVGQKVVQKGLRLLIDTAPDAPLSLIGDQHRLSQIIVNLLSNAVKFTEAGRVALETVVQERDGERIKLKFIVRDTGMGISDQLIKKLFQPFTQADGSTTRRFGGTGLGLSISKQLVRMMGGEIWCESKAGLGSTFFFTAWFGLDEQSETAQAPSVRSSGAEELTVPDFSGARILLAEDNEINTLLADAMLFETGAVMDHAVDGQEAVRMIIDGTVRYDLVLMDLRMPVLDGYQASRIIRNDSRFGGLPIVAMTAHAMTEVQQAVLEAGMSALVTKPINRWNLLRVMQSFLHAPGASDPEKTGETFAKTNPDPAGIGLAGRSSARPAPRGSPPGPIDASQISPILNQLLNYIKGSNGKAERYLDSYHEELAGLPKHDLSQVKACLKNFDFAAARRAILSLARQNGIQLSPEHMEELHS